VLFGARALARGYRGLAALDTGSAV
jgi:hypothetical protein